MLKKTLLKDCRVSLLKKENGADRTAWLKIGKNIK